MVHENLIIKLIKLFEKQRAQQQSLVTVRLLLKAFNYYFQMEIGVIMIANAMPLQFHSNFVSAAVIPPSSLSLSFSSVHFPTPLLISKTIEFSY